MIYTKLLISIPDQIVLLKSGDLAFADETNAEQVLEHISYYRFAAFLRPMEAGKVTRLFNSGATAANRLGFSTQVPTEYDLLLAPVWMRQVIKKGINN